MTLPQSAIPAQQPLDALRQHVRQRGGSPLAQAAFRSLLMVAGGTLGVFLLGLLPLGPSLQAWLMGLVAAPTWILAVSTLLRDSPGRRVWPVIMGVGVLFLPFSGASGFGAAMAMLLSGAFVVFQPYRIYRHLTSIRRAQLFLVAVTSFVLLVVVGASADPTSWLNGVGVHTARYLIWSLRVFWLFTALHLFFTTRLHFLRIRPKLAVTALLFALVPMTLGLVFASVALYGVLGGARAMEAREILLERAHLVRAQPELGHQFFAEEIILDDPPNWEAGSFPPKLRAMVQDGLFDSARSDSSQYLVIGRDLWLMLGTPEPRIRLFHADASTFVDLSKRLNCEIEFLGGDNFSVNSSGGNFSFNTRDGGIDLMDRDRSWWELPYFGAATLGVIIHDEEDRYLDSRDGLLLLRTSPAALWSEYTEGEGNVNQVLIFALIVIATLMVTVELIALFLGIRITGSVTSAIRQLHRSTEQIARGDLDVVIDIPNEDELGDLADSFNEMTTAVKLGQNQALLRERLEQEMLTARRIQERLLPSESPDLTGWEIVGLSIPSTQVGGDYYDFLPLPGGKLGIAIGDVTGKGVPAALLMSNLQASLQGQVIHPSSVSDVMARVNDLLAASTDSHMFATFYYGVLDPGSGTLTGASAGHDPPILARADGSLEMLDRGGLILGMLPGQTYQEDQVVLGPGDVLVLYTDGITEAMGPLPLALTSGDPEPEDPDDDPEEDANFFGLERLMDVVRSAAQRPAVELRQAILDAVQAHAQDVPQSDDITLVVVKRTAP